MAEQEHRQAGVLLAGEVGDGPQVCDDGVTAVVVGARDATEVIEDVIYLSTAVPAELLAELGTRADSRPPGRQTSH